jgi:tetratricopeptide (TPR) repeat protein
MRLDESRRQASTLSTEKVLEMPAAPPSPKVFKRAVAAYERGNLGKTVELCKATIKAAPDHFDALHLLAVAMSRSGAHATALLYFDRAALLRPRNLDVFNNRGSALAELGRYEEALADYDKALTIRSEHAGVLNNRGCVLMLMKRFEEALVAFGRALVLSPNNAEIVNNLGRALLREERFEDAADCFDEAVRLKPDYFDALINRGITLNLLEKFDDALSCMNSALEIKPDYAPAIAHRSQSLAGLERYEEARLDCDRALELLPPNYFLLVRRGSCLKKLGRPEEAVVALESALGLTDHDEISAPDPSEPSYDELPDRLHLRSMVLMQLERTSEALACVRKAVELREDFQEAAWNLSCLSLQHGDFDAGWRFYEARRAHKRTNWTKLDGPEWRGEDLTGKRLLLYGEQANGDAFQYVRFVRFAARMGAEVILGVWAPLAAIFRGMEEKPIIVCHGEKLPAYDFHLPLMSFPWAMKLQPEDFATDRPYLRADPKRVELWENRLPKSTFRVGIAWEGSKSDPERSIPLSELAPLSRISGVTLISLQKSDGLDQIAGAPADMRVTTLGPDFDAGPDAFLDTAAVMMCLDLVISIDTGVAHLAGALGRPLWILLKRVPEWRWMLDRADSPWYPSARLFRQKTSGQWGAVIDDIAIELDRLVTRLGNARPS